MPELVTKKPAIKIKVAVPAPPVEEVAPVQAPIVAVQPKVELE